MNLTCPPCTLPRAPLPACCTCLPAVLHRDFKGLTAAPLSRELPSTDGSHIPGKNQECEPARRAACSQGLINTWYKGQPLASRWDNWGVP